MLRPWLIDMIYEKISAFADEISENFDLQLAGLKENGINYMEIRGVDGKNISVLSQDEIIAVKSKLDNAGIKVSSIGSPVGKFNIEDDFSGHLSVVENVLEAAKILETKYIRIFSFYIPSGEDYKKFRSPVMSKLEKLLEMAEKNNLILCHENERHIYGESPEACLDIMENFGGKIRSVFDHANFITASYEPYPYAYNMLKAYIEYMHIKDAGKDGIMPAGQGTGQIKETLTDLIKERGYNNFITLEPHLSIFKGLEELEKADSNPVKNKFESKDIAFRTAKNALYCILEDVINPV